MSYRQLNIMFGSACDMKCGYCLQTNGLSPADKKADAQEFVQKLLPHLNGQTPKKIMYWGGEPMLYWERIKTIHSLLSENGIVPSQSVITTNGRRLTESYVDYANSHEDIWTTVSCHGWDFTNKQLETIFKLKRFSLSELVHHFRTDLWEIRDRYYEIKDKFGVSPNLCVHFLSANDGCNTDYYMTKEDVDKFCDHIRTEVIPMARLGDEWAQWQCSQLLFERDRIIAKGIGPLCVRSDQLSIDLHGNVYNCHHNYCKTNIVRNVFEKVIPIQKADSLCGSRFFNSEECQSCELLEQCRGGCYTSNTHEVDCYFAKERAKLYEIMERR